MNPIESLMQKHNRWVKLVLALTVVAIATSFFVVNYADDYECTVKEGCDALNTVSGNVVKFRNGDIVSTERGFVVAGVDGWVEVDAPTLLAAALAGDLAMTVDDIIGVYQGAGPVKTWKCSGKAYCCAYTGGKWWQKLKWTLPEFSVIDSDDWYMLPGQGWKLKAEPTPECNDGVGTLPQSNKYK